MSCVLCDDPAQTGDVVFEDERSLVMLHSDWSVRGHAMIVAKQHVENVADLGREEWLHFAALWQRAERVLLDVTNADRAIALKLGVQTPHLHVHLYPVTATTEREEVFAMIDMNTRVPRDEAFIEDVRRALLTPTSD